VNSEINLSLSQVCGAWQQMCVSFPQAAFAETSAAQCLFAGIPIPFFNLGVLTREASSPEDLAGQAGEVCAWAQPHQLPWFLMATHENLAPGVDAAAVLDDLGLMPLLNLTGMIAEEVAPATSLPEGLALAVPESDAGLLPMVTVNEAAYGMDMQCAYPMMANRAFWKGHVPVVGSVAGEPVSCSAVMQVDGHHYVAFVASHPDHRRRGYADAAMRHSLEVAAQTHGKAPTFLHATDAGRPVYERMGYRAVSSHTLFIEKKFMEGHDA
jgi:GNAT superfamily N-acetyltransferase